MRDLDTLEIAGDEADLRPISLLLIAPYSMDLQPSSDLDISSRRRPEKRSPTLAAAAAAKAATDGEEGDQIVLFAAWGEEEEATGPLASEAERALSIEEAVKALLQRLGEDHEREGLRRMPHRVAEAFRGGTRGYKQKVKDIVQGALFPEAGLNPGVGHAGGVGGLVVVRDIDLFSYCESCLLPFSIKCHVGYVPSGGRVVGLSKLSRVADVFARRFQDPKRLASEVCAALHNSINLAGVAVSLQCWHMKFSHLCDTNFTHSTISDMQSWGTILASSRSGVFKEGKNSLWDDFTSLLILSGILHPRLKEHMEYCINHPEEMSKLSKLKAHITEVKGIMMDNIEKDLMTM
ncbi:GTP cyclohydrolase 1-like [Zingiber officinale]|uniref:GTP cyclohydrolase 1-like n=1 Tax=Zingiber officinale TaxID=94328 RepID=UPI001C4C4F4F|nr:GTP cyclohydrolase 1-like [Zingiber officinale]